MAQILHRGVAAGLFGVALLAVSAAKGQPGPSSAEAVILECHGVERVALNGGEVSRHGFTGLLIKLKEAQNSVEVSASRDTPFALFCADAESRQIRFSEKAISVNCEYPRVDRSLTISRMSGVLADHTISYRGSLPVEKFMDAQCVAMSSELDQDGVKRHF